MWQTKTWLRLIAAVLLLCVGLTVWLATRPAASTVVEIVQNGTVLQRIDLAAVTEEYSFTVSDGNGGSNQITVQPGRICISAADCPDLICVHHGWLPDNRAPIVCLPHQLMILSVDDATTDASIDATAQ